MTPVVFESIIFALLALLALTQVIIPAWRGMPLFPCFLLSLKFVDVVHQ